MSHHGAIAALGHAFLKSWFETVAYAKSRRAETIAEAVKDMKRSEAVETKEHDLVLTMASDDGNSRRAVSRCWRALSSSSACWIASPI